jgi:glucose dehydrogenase
MGAPDRTEAPAPGQFYTTSTPNAWAPMTGDAALGLVYVPLGSPSPDFFGAGRRDFDEKYSSSLVALSVTDGRPRWSFQFVHHDLWDRDVPMQALLADIRIGGRLRHALIQGTKQGDIYVLDRETGEPIVPVEEKPVPEGGLPEEPHSPTQPHSALSLMPPPLTEADMWGLTPLDQLICRIEFRKARYQGAYTAPGTDETLIYPGLTGTMSWGGLSFDPVRQQILANITLIPWIGQLVRKEEAGADTGERSKTAPEGAEMRGTPYRWKQRPFLSPLGVPCNAPPWGKLVAVDVARRKINWS